MSSRSSGGRAGLALFLAVCVAPVAAGLGYALLYSMGLAGLLARGLTLDAWHRVLADPELGRSALLSLAVATITVVLTAAVAGTLGLVLRDRLARGPLTLFLHVPLGLPAIVAAFLALQLLSGAGLVARLGVALGFYDDVARFPSLVQDRFAIGIVLTHTALAVPFFTLLTALLHRGERVETYVELATSLGASPRQALLRVTLPMLLRRARLALVLLWVGVFGSFEVPLVLGRQSPQMLSVLTWRRSGLYDLAERPQAFAIALLYSAGVLLLLALAMGKEAADAR